MKSIECSIDADAARELALALKKNTVLTSLNLSCKDHVKLLCTALC